MENAWSRARPLLNRKDDSAVTQVSSPGRTGKGGARPSESRGGLATATHANWSCLDELDHVTLKATRETHAPSPPGTGSGRWLAVLAHFGRPKVVAASSRKTKTGVVTPVLTEESVITGYWKSSGRADHCRRSTCCTAAGDGAGVACVRSRDKCKHSSCCVGGRWSFSCWVGGKSATPSPGSFSCDSGTPTSMLMVTK